MSDPLARVAATDREPDLFSILPPPAKHSTRTEGLLASGATVHKRYQQITDLLREHGPLANWQIAELLRCQPHQTSGRLTEMVEQRLIEKTGERRKNPRTNVSGEVVRLAREEP